MNGSSCPRLGGNQAKGEGDVPHDEGLSASRAAADCVPGVFHDTLSTIC